MRRSLTGCKQRGGDHRRNPSRNRRTDLSSKRKPRVSHGSGKHLSEPRTLRRGHQSLGNSRNNKQREIDKPHGPRLKQPEKRKHEQSRQQSPRQIHRPTSHFVRYPTEKRYSHELRRRTSHQSSENLRLRNPQLLRRVNNHKGLIDVSQRVVPQPRTPGAKQRPAGDSKHLADR